MVKDMIKHGFKKTIVFSVIAIMAIAILSCFESYAIENNRPNQRVVKVGYFQDYATILEPATAGNMGYGYDYLQEIAKYTGWKYEFIKCSWDDGIKFLEEGKIDIFGPMQKTEEREDIFDFPNTQMGVEYGVIFADKNSGILYEDLDFFDGMKVGTERENYYTKVMEEYCLEKGIRVQYVYTDAMDIGAELKSGLYDTYITGDLQAIPNTTVVARMSFEPYYYATTKGNTEITLGIDYALQNIFRNDKYFEQRLYEKYFSKRDISKPSITKAEMELIKKHNKLIVGCDSQSRPLQYFNQKTGEPSGISMDILKEVGNICGIEFEFVPIKAINGTILKEQFKNIDLYACYHNHKNSENIECTNTYLSAPMTLVSDKLINLSEKLNVAMYSFDDKNESQLLKEYPQFKVKKYGTPDEVIDAFEKGMADVMFITRYTYDELEKVNGDTSYYINATDIKCRMDIGVSEALPKEMLNILNKSIAILDDDVVNTIIYKNTVTRTYEATISKVIKDNIWMMLGVIIIFFAILVSVIERNNRKLRSVLYVDNCTGKGSFAKFKIEAIVLLKHAKPDEYMLVSIDVNDFKYINDIYGYDLGNKVLKILSDHIEMILPDEKMLCARRSADNFVFISKTANKAKILETLSDNTSLIEDVKGILGQDYNLALSFGIYVIKKPFKSLPVMLDYANIAKKTMKGKVGDPIAEYTAEMDKHMELKKKITICMEASLQHGEFITCMQPKYSLVDESLVGAEVLARWKHPEMGMLSPIFFIPLFEQNGFIEKLDMYMFESTCKMIQKWRKGGVTKIPRISVNISRATLSRINLVDELKKITEKYEVETDWLEIEITEGTFESNTEKIIEIINKFKLVGFYVSIDDFGSGYSSLNILKDMPADIIKIDKEFLSDTFYSEKGKKIINSVIKMSKELNLETLVEGIETKEQAKVLKNMGCDVAQGYYFSKPIKPEEFENMIVSTKYKNC